MKKLYKLLYALLAAAAAFLSVYFREPASQEIPQDIQMTELNAYLENQTAEDEWSSTYEIYVHSFCDSDGDGIGDLKGVEQKLDYVQELGFRNIWLMPIAASPSSHKYDVTDYCAVDEQYGTLEDFDSLVQQMHARGMKLIVDLVLNHTSDQHPWFLEAKKYLNTLEGREPSSEECRYLDYYRFSREPKEGYEKMWDGDWYYEARFIGSMPDLNLDNPAVREEIRKIMEFWIHHGVNGFRLDAVTSYYTGDDESNIAFMHWLTETGRSMKPDLYFVGEAWTGRDTYASYYRSGMDSFFDFAFAGDSGVIKQAVNEERGIDSWIRECKAGEELYAQYSDHAVNAPFYTNHDVNRSESYYVEEKEAKIKLAEGLNLLMGGNAFVYYGEELGMAGSGRDENKRAPMYWSKDADCPETCAAPEWMEEFSMPFGSWEEQKDDPFSIYRYVQEAVKIRNAFPAIAHGTTYVIDECTDAKVCTFVRSCGCHPDVLVVVNGGWERQERDLSSLGEMKLAAVLNTNSEYVCLDDGSLKIPARSVAVITEP